MQCYRYMAILLVAATLAFTACSDNGDDNGGGGNAVITIAAISGVTAPVLGASPAASITETDQYTGTVTWDGGWAWSPYFGGAKAYTATVTLTAQAGYTLTGVTADFFTVAGATSATNTADTGVVTVVFPATATVAIGDAVLGGKAAYILQSGDPGYVAGEQRGLIAAASDQSAGISWASIIYQSIEVPGGTGTAIGTGPGNTDAIIAQNGTGITFAAGLARAYNGGSYTDWYLPSKDELNQLYVNKTAVGGFAANFYWSSSEIDAFNAWNQFFSDGSLLAGEKDDTCLIRAVRAF